MSIETSTGGRYSKNVRYLSCLTFPSHPAPLIIRLVIDPNLPFNLLRRFGRSPLLWLGVPVLLYGWSITGPYVFDDLNLVLNCERYAAGEREELGLFRFAPTAEDWLVMRSRGTYPWWSPAGKRMDFFRPLAEWSFYLDVRLFGRNPLGPRVESLLLFAVALLFVRRLYLAVVDDPVQAGVATFFLGISQCLTQPATFLSNRSDLFVIIGLALAAMAYFQMRQRMRLGWMLLGVLGFSIALLAKESGVAFAGVIVLFDLSNRVINRGSAASSTSKATLTYVASIVVLGAAYLAFYASTRGGNIGTASGGDASGQLLKIVQTGLLYGAVWTTGVPVVLLGTAPAAVGWAVAAAGGVLSLIVLLSLRPSLRQGPVRFFLLWSVVMMTPALLAFPESRALSVATVGWACVLSHILLTRTSSKLALLGQHWLLNVNGIVSIIVALATIVVMNQTEYAARAAMRERVADISTAELSNSLLLIKEADDPFETLCAGDRLQWVSGASDVRVAFLTLTGAKATIHQENDRVWLIRGAAPELFDSPAHRLTLGSAFKPTVGHRFELRDFTIEIAELDEDGYATALRLILNGGISLDDVYTWPRDLLQ